MMKKLLIVCSIMLLSGINLFAQQPGTKIDYGLSNILQTYKVNYHKDESKQKSDPPFLFAQQIGIKVGIGFPTVYETNEVNYYRNKLNHESNPSLILTFRFNYHIVGNLFIAWEPGVMENTGKITGIAQGVDNQNNGVYGYSEYRMWNLDNSFLLNYDLTRIKEIMVNIYLGTGFSWNLSDKQDFIVPVITYNRFTDFPNYDYGKPYMNDSGTYITTGINLQYRNFQFDLRYIKDDSKLGIVGIGTHKSYLYSFLIGYEL